MQRMMMVGLVLALVMVCGSGCATKMVEAKAQRTAISRGYTPSDVSPEILRAPQGSGKLGMSLSQAAWEYHPVLYGLANLFDYGVIPAGTVGAGVAVANEMNGGGSQTTHNFNNEGPVNQVNGDNNSTGNTTDNSTQGGTP